MSEYILRTFYTNNGIYALTQGSRYGIPHLFYKPKFLDGNVPKWEIRSKAVLEDGSILRKGEGYSIVMPKGGTGNFSIINGEYKIEGILEKGKLTNLIDFYRQGKSTDYLVRTLDFGKDGEKYTRSSIEEILKQVSTGGLQLHNQTIIILKKILKFLPK